MKAATASVTMRTNSVSFQSTPPVKAATDTGVTKEGAFGISIHAAREGGDCKHNHLRTYTVISIHAAREGGDYAQQRAQQVEQISIHAAREGGDSFESTHLVPKSIFQSTPPVKAATTDRALQQVNAAISIHAAREGGDGTTLFNSLCLSEFQSTPPVKAATKEIDFYGCPQ